MRLRRLTLRHKVVLLVALGATLWVLGQWAIGEASPVTRVGWTGYAPLTASNGLGPSLWLQVVLWLALIAVWTVAALLLLREPRPSAIEVEKPNATDSSE